MTYYTSIHLNWTKLIEKNIFIIELHIIRNPEYIKSEISSQNNESIGKTLTVHTVLFIENNTLIYRKTVN